MNNKTATIRKALKEYLDLHSSPPHSFAEGLLGACGGGGSAVLWLCPGQLTVIWDSATLYFHFFFFSSGVKTVGHFLGCKWQQTIMQ